MQVAAADARSTAAARGVDGAAVDGNAGEVAFLPVTHQASIVPPARTDGSGAVGTLNRDDAAVDLYKGAGITADAWTAVVGVLNDELARALLLTEDAQQSRLTHFEFFQTELGAVAKDEVHRRLFLHTKIAVQGVAAADVIGTGIKLVRTEAPDVLRFHGHRLVDNLLRGLVPRALDVTYLVAPGVRPVVVRLLHGWPNNVVVVLAARGGDEADAANQGCGQCPLKHHFHNPFILLFICIVVNFERSVNFFNFSNFFSNHFLTNSAGPVW